MNRADFGKLIASLRREHEDERGFPWTQERLAQEANIVVGAEVFNQYIIGTIEQGRRGLDEQTLLALATALQLTSGERKEFFLAASGVANDKITRHDNDPQDVLLHLINRMKQVHLPSYIIDSYYEMIAVSASMFDILDLKSAGLVVGSEDHNPFPYNMLRFMFWDEEERDYMGKLIGEEWPWHVYQTMINFRAISLRYRSTEYFQSLLQVLKQSRKFRRLWGEVYFEERDYLFDKRHVHFDSPTWGPIDYCSWLNTALTRAGDLHLCILAPANFETSNTFASIVHKAGPDNIIRLGSWPEKTLAERQRCAVL